MYPLIRRHANGVTMRPTPRTVARSRRPEARDVQRRFVFSTSVTDWIRTACDIAGSGFTHAEWLRYVGDRPYRATCSAPLIGRSGVLRRSCNQDATGALQAARHDQS
jgi:hypothetical protein